MYKITGKVLVKETGIGIPDLQVVMYDLDTHPQTSPDNSEVFPAHDQPAEFFWQTLPGDRLGSVLTDANGYFELLFEDKDFIRNEQIQRPDLILFVLAPEDTDHEHNGMFVARPPSERVLHYSYDPVVNSGTQESYIIRLYEEVLVRFHIPLPSVVSMAQPGPPTAESVVATLHQSFEFEREVKATLNQQTIARMSPVLAVKDQITEAFRNFSLSKAGPEIRANDTYLNPGESLLPKLERHIDSSLAGLSAKDAGANRRLVLHLSEEQIHSWGLTVDTEGNVSGTLSRANVLDYLRQTTGAGPLEVARPVLENCLVEQEAERLFAEALTRCSVGGPDGGGDPPDITEPPELTTAVLLREHIGRQMRYAGPPEKELEYGVEKNGELVATIRKPSPTDVTSYHDFQELQIAFEHVWTEAFGGSLPTLLRSIYGEMVRFQNRVSGTGALPEVRNVQDMYDLYEEFATLQELLESENEEAAPTEPSLILPVPQPVKNLCPELTNEQWSSLDASEQANLSRIAREQADAQKAWDIFTDALRPISPWFVVDMNPAWQTARIAFVSESDRRMQDARAVIQSAGERRRQQQSQIPDSTRNRGGARTSDRLSKLMKELDERLSESYRFDIFAPESMNYGLMLTYRQKWVPGNYQVGDLISTIPLAPKEIRKYSTKQVVKKSRTQKEIEDNQSSRTSESSSTSRAESEIVKQARDKTSFEQTANGQVSIGVFQGQFGTRFGTEAEKSSSSTKKNFREAVMKSAEEYKQQRRLEIETTTTEEVETIHSGEIMNPNDEITVTYLFYELQRQYQISEKIHRLTPVILVANPVPLPDEIDDDWLIAHDWILRRVILDNSFLPALSYVTSSAAGDELALQVLRGNVERQINLVEELTKQVKIKNTLAGNAFQELRRLTGTATTAGDAEKLKDIAMAMAFGPFSLAGGGGDNEAAEKREEIAKLAIERADKEVQEVNAKLAREVTALHESVSKYTVALQEHFYRRTSIARLRIHIKEHLFYYMQAIWDYETPDQRYFRLYNLPVPWIETEDITLTAIGVSGRPVGRSDSLRIAPVDTSRYEVELTVPATATRRVTKTLSEVADLDNLLGYKGNYMIFPVKQANYLHTYMMQDYIDPRTGGLRDPDEFSNYSTEDIQNYICCLQRRNPELLAANRDYLLSWIRRRLETPRKESELVVVPTGSTYIEALPGKHPILEDFKLAHRALDVKKVQAEVRNAELENIRLAARLLEGEREDPEIDRKIEIEGTGADPVIISET